jgi:hypothetical protein
MATFAKAIIAFNKIHKVRTTREIGIALGVPENYNKEAN